MENGHQLITARRSVRAVLFMMSVAGAALFVFGLVRIAHAAVSVNSATNLTTFNQTMSSTTVLAVIGINVVGTGGEKIASTSIAFSGSSGFSTTTDIKSLGIATSSGVALYRDNKAVGTTGSFDSADYVVPLSSAVWNAAGATTTLSLTGDGEVAPANDTGVNAGYDYFIVISASSTAANGHAFTTSMYPGSIQWNGGNTPGASPTTLTTNTITIDTIPPVVNRNASWPQNGATSVPVSSFIHFGFNKTVDQSTLNANNITLTTSTTSTNFAIRPFPDGFDLVLSSAPAYTSSSRFAKATTVSTGFFQINGTSQIFPQGAYTTPVVGDIVYMQLDTFPPEVGVVTNATLTSGTFGVNGYALFKSLQLTKFATPTQTGFADQATVVFGVGDLAVANTAANPTDIKYNWHIVTTGGAANAAGLRFDGAGGSPTFATTSISRLMPAATSTIDGSGVFVASTTFNIGDLVFAKLTAGGDNLNTYAWHLVTAKTGLGILGPQAGGGTVSLDGGTPTFAANSTIAKLTTAAQGAVDTGPQDATSFAFGDLMFAKVTANAANTGSYAFHLITNGATGATSTALRFDNASANFIPSTQYTATITTGVKDSAGNPIVAATSTVFTTGSTGATNVTPPSVVSSQPQQGSQQFAPNNKIKITFNQSMLADGSANAVDNTAVVKLSTSVNGQPGTATSTTNSYDATTLTLTITPAATLQPNTDFVVQITTAAKTATSVAFPTEYRLYFHTASAADALAPTVLGMNPTSGSTGISLSQIFGAGISKDIDPSTVNSTTVKVITQIGGTNATGTVTYSAPSRSINFTPSVLLVANTGYTFQIGAGNTGPTDLAGNKFAATSTAYATTTSAADTTAPTISFATADNFGAAVTFSKTMKIGGGPNAIDNIINYTIESPVGTTISLGGKTVSYDASTRTARISGLSLQNQNTFKITVATPVQDLAGNGISTSGTPAGNTAYGTVQDALQTGGSLGPGSGMINQSQQGMNPTNVMPMNRGAGATSQYTVTFLASTSIPVGGQIVLTFPTGFDVTNAAMVATSSSGTGSMCNNDINMQGAGVPYIPVLNVSNNAAAGTITLTTAGATTGDKGFICLDLSGIVNSSVPSSSGYQVDVKTRDTTANNRAILESKTSAPFYLGTAGNRTVTANVFNDGNGNGTIDANEGIAGVKAFMFSPAAGGFSATTNASGVATFSNVADGDYQMGIDPSSLATASSTVTYNSAPQPFTVSASSLTKNFIVSGAGSTVTISGVISGPANTAITIFASSPNGFTKKTMTLTGGSDAYSMPVKTNTTYQVGVGPAMPDTAFIPGAPPPPPPSFTFMPPPPLTVVVAAANVPGQNFTLVTASKTITGSVVDSNGNGVSNAGIFARPISATTNTQASTGFGTGGMTNTSGAFSINVVPGTYLVGVFKPGMPTVPDKQIVVPSSGSNSPSSLTFTLGAGTSLTISGTVKDDSGNAIPYAGVSARKVVSTSDTTPIGGNSGNFVGGPTDSNGAYTLYVDAGTWYIEAYAPRFGKLGSKTVTVSTASLSGQDFSAQTLSLGTITGTTTVAGSATQGVMVRADGASGSNATVSDSNGVYTLKVPSGSNYTVSCYFPGIGDAAPLTGITVTTNTTTYSNNCSISSLVTVYVRLTDGTNPITGGYVDLRDSNGRGNGTGVSTTTGAYAVYAVSVRPGTYTVRAGHPAYGPIGSTSGVSTAQTITYTATAGALFAVTGTVRDGSGSALSGAWVSLNGTPSGQSNTIMIGTQSDSSGAISLNVPAGTYTYRIDKPGYISPSPQTITISAAYSLGTISMVTASQTISGTVTLSGSPVSGAFVDATSAGSGFAVAQTSSDGTYSLSLSNGTWNLKAHSMGYEGSLSNVAAGATGQTITLSAISGFTVKAEHQETVTPTAGGLLTNSDIGSNFKLNIPANALGTGSNAGTVKTQVNTAVPSAANGTVLSKNTVSISAVDSSGQPIKSLNDNVSIVVPYSTSDLPAGTSESSLQLGTWNDATRSYDMLPTTVDTTNKTLTAIVSHFSDYAPIAPSTASSNSSNSTPASSSGGGGGGGGGGGTGGVPVPVRPQIIYPDGRVAYLDVDAQGRSTEKKISGTVVAPVAEVAAHSGAALPTGTFNAALRIGNKGSDVSRLQTLLGVEATEYFGSLTLKSLKAFQIKYGIAKKGEDGFGVMGPKTRAKLNELMQNGTPGQVAPPSVSGNTGSAGTSGSFSRPLSVGMTSTEIRTLQQILNRDPDTRITESGDGAPGHESNYFGKLTKTAVERFQIKYGIATKGDSAFGYVGPKTRAKLNDLSSSTQ